MFFVFVMESTVLLFVDWQLKSIKSIFVGFEQKMDYYIHGMNERND